MGKEILIHEKEPDALKFLKAFFKWRKEYTPHFINDEVSLMSELKLKKPSALIVGVTAGIRKIKTSHRGCPVIAVVSGDVRRGLAKVTRNGIDSYILHPFYEKDLEFKLKNAISEWNMIEHFTKEKKEMETIIDLTYLVSSTLDPREILYLIVKKIADVIHVTRCSIIRIDGKERYAHVVATFEDPMIRDVKLDLRKYPEIKKALTSKRPVIIEDIKTDPIMYKVRDALFPLGIRSILVIPIMFREEVIGTLFLRTAKSSNAFTDGEIRLCNAIANASANALHNAFLFEKIVGEKRKLEKLAITDFLTGIYNIRYFYHRLGEEFSRSQRYNVALSCIMFDIDYFKKINDTYGHRVGDMVLREFAQFVRRHTRKSDVFARYGGEEFILLLPQTPLIGAIAEAERLRRALKEHNFKALSEEKGITVSIGIAFCPDEEIKTQDDLISCADSALFTAKNKGRDQTIIHSTVRNSLHLQGISC